MNMIYNALLILDTNKEVIIDIGTLDTLLYSFELEINHTTNFD
jgi:hypothetical protein